MWGKTGKVFAVLAGGVAALWVIVAWACMLVFMLVLAAVGSLVLAFVEVVEVLWYMLSHMGMRRVSRHKSKER